MNKNIKILFIVILWIFFSFLIKNIYLHVKWYNKAIHSHSDIMKIDFYCQTLQCYIPLSPLNSRSINNILYIAKRSHKKNNILLELYAYERLRSTLYSIRNLYQPYLSLRNGLTLKIATIKSKLLYKNNPSDYREKLLKSMNIDFAPNIFWSIIVELSFIIWILGILLIILNTFKNKKIIVVVTFFSYLLFCLSLYLA